jgi:hypothetical protein
VSNGKGIGGTLISGSGWLDIVGIRRVVSPHCTVRTIPIKSMGRPMINAYGKFPMHYNSIIT